MKCHCEPLPSITSTPADYAVDAAFGYTTHGVNFPGLLTLNFNQSSSLAGFAITSQAGLLAISFPHLVDAGVTFGFSSNTALNSISAPVLKNAQAVTVGSNPMLALIDFPMLESAGLVSMSSNATLAVIRLPRLVTATSITGTSNPLLFSVVLSALKNTTGSAGFNFAGNVALTSLSAPLLETVSTSLNISGCTALVNLSLPSLITAAGANGINASGCTLLANVSLPAYVPTNGRPQTFNACALTEVSVDHILARCVANAGYVSGTINLSGGTSAPPSATGLLDKATLQARGVTVLTN